jgi:ribosomal protein S18 acetylase RimI-like enzyme
MQDILLKEKNENDSEFFMELFSEIKSSELHLDLWPEANRNQLIAMQFHAFEQCMKAEFPNSVDYLIVYQSGKAGRLQLDKNDNGIRIINISLLSAYRDKGLGTKIINGIITEANQKKIPVYLDVDKTNPAVNLYSKMGFSTYQQNDLKYSMIYNPAKD